MTFDDMVHRLFKMSFDPYHCIELRWGAEDVERESCPDQATKLRWYAAEQRLRKQPDRTYDSQMGFSVVVLILLVRWSGIDSPPPVDIKALIDTMPDQVAFQPMKPGDR